MGEGKACGCSVAEPISKLKHSGLHPAKTSSTDPRFLTNKHSKCRSTPPLSPREPQPRRRTQNGHGRQAIEGLLGPGDFGLVQSAMEPHERFAGCPAARHHVACVGPGNPTLDVALAQRRQPIKDVRGLDVASAENDLIHLMDDACLKHVLGCPNPCCSVDVWDVRRQSTACPQCEGLVLEPFHLVPSKQLNHVLHVLACDHQTTRFEWIS